MTLEQIIAWWPQFASATAGLGGGGLITGYLSHRRAKRKQTDEVALGIVEKLQVRVDAVEQASAQERKLCDAKLEVADQKIAVLRHELGIVESAFDGLLLAIRFAPPERIPEIVEIAQRQRAERGARKGEARNAAQIELSAHRVIPDID